MFAIFVSKCSFPRPTHLLVCCQSIAPHLGPLCAYVSKHQCLFYTRVDPCFCTKISLFAQCWFDQPTSSWPFMSLECLVVSLKPPFGFHLCFIAFDKNWFRFFFVLIIRLLENLFCWPMITWMNCCYSPHSKKCIWISY